MEATLNTRNLATLKLQSVNSKTIKTRKPLDYMSMRHTLLYVFPSATLKVIESLQYIYYNTKNKINMGIGGIWIVNISVLLT